MDYSRRGLAVALQFTQPLLQEVQFVSSFCELCVFLAERLIKLDIFLSKGLILVAGFLQLNQFIPQICQFCIFLGDLLIEVSGVLHALWFVLQLALESIDLMLLRSQSVLVLVRDALVLCQLGLQLLSLVVTLSYFSPQICHLLAARDVLIPLVLVLAIELADALLLFQLEDAVAEIANGAVFAIEVRLKNSSLFLEAADSWIALSAYHLDLINQFLNLAIENFDITAVRFLVNGEFML